MGKGIFAILKGFFEILSFNSPLNLTFLKGFLKVRLYKASLIMIVHFLGVFERLFERKLPFKKPFKKIHVIFFERFFERYYTPTSICVLSKACTYFSFFERFFEIQQIKGAF